MQVDLFDLVNCLAFDPPDKNAKRVREKIEQKKTDLNMRLGRATLQADRDAIQAKIDYLDSAAERIFSPDGRKFAGDAYFKLANQKVTAELASLSAIVDLLTMAGIHAISDVSLKHYRQETRLSADHVKQVFIKSGFKIIDSLAALPKFPTNADRIYTELAALRRTNDPNPHGADSSVVDDLYSFAAYIMDDVGNIPLYKAMGTKELWGIFDLAWRKYSQRGDDLGKLCGSLSAAAKTYVFNSDENRSAYDLHLVYRSEELNELFEKMRRVPEETLLNPIFADYCINLISGYFPEYEVALAIYNKESGTCFRPTVQGYKIKCSYCGYISDYETEVDALEINACKSCDKPLFKKCNGCGKLVLVSSDHCPYCDYAFAKPMLFAKWCEQSISAFERNDFEATRYHLRQAQFAAPGEIARIEQLLARVAESELTFDELKMLHQQAKIDLNEESTANDSEYTSQVTHGRNTYDGNRVGKDVVYGIQIGNTHAAISFINEAGIPEIIPNLNDCSELLRTAVYFPSGADPVIGQVAVNNKCAEPGRVVEFVERFIGKVDAPIYEFNNILYDPVTITALILGQMKTYADLQGHDVKNVVIACPAYFGYEERKATKQAGTIAGLNVLEIIDEPTAAALNYCVHEFKESRKIMVYDLGGVTFDITLFDFSVDEGGKAFIDIIKSHGNDRLGGIDWDARMFDYMCAQYAYENSTEVGDMDDELRAIINAQVEKAKKDLSTLEKKSYTIKYDGDRTRIELTRQDFEEQTQDLVEQTIDIVHQLLSGVGLGAEDVDVVLLVGGSTFMPMIKNAVEELFPGKIRFEQPNLAVAKGAALSAIIC